MTFDESMLKEELVGVVIARSGVLVGITTSCGSNWVLRADSPDDGGGGGGGGANLMTETR